MNLRIFFRIAVSVFLLSSEGRCGKEFIEPFDLVAQKQERAFLKKTKALQSRMCFYEKAISSLEHLLINLSLVNNITFSKTKPTFPTRVGDNRIFLEPELADDFFGQKCLFLKEYVQNEKELIAQSGFSFDPFICQQLGANLYFLETHQEKLKRCIPVSSFYDEELAKFEKLIKAKTFFKAFEARKKVIQKMIQKQDPVFLIKGCGDTNIAQQYSVPQRTSILEVVETAKNISNMHAMIEEKKSNLSLIQKHTLNSQYNEEVHVFVPYLIGVLCRHNMCAQFYRKEACFAVSDNYILNAQDFKRIKRWMLLLEFEKSAYHALEERKTLLAHLKELPVELALNKEFVFNRLRDLAVHNNSVFQKDGAFVDLWKSIIADEAKKESVEQKKSACFTSYCTALFGFSQLRSSELLLRKMSEAENLIFE